MRKIVTGLFISLDGVVEAPHDWHLPYFTDEMAAIVAAQMASADTILIGRRTYEDFAAAWPNRTTDEDPGAAFMNDTPKLVVSTTLNTVEWANSTLLRGVVADELAALKQAPGKDILVIGSPTLVRSLLREGAIDELSLLLHPIVVGAGQRLFTDDGGPIRLELVASTRFSTGVLQLTYRPA